MQMTVKLPVMKEYLIDSFYLHFCSTDFSEIIYIIVQFIKKVKNLLKFLFGGDGVALDNMNINLLQKSLDGLWLKQRVISHNIANLDTPAYKTKTVAFEDVLADIQEKSENSKQLTEKLKEAKPEVVETDAAPLREDGNNVDIDKENIEMVRAQLQYEYTVRMLSDEISRLKYAINEGRN